MHPLLLMAILLVSLVISGCAPIFLLLMPPRKAQRVVRWAMLGILPTLAISCGVLVSQGEAGFLGLAQWITMSSFFLAIAFGFSYGASLAKEAWLARKPAIRDEDWSDG